MAAENILLLTIQQGAVEGGVQEPYVARSGETLEADKKIPALVYIMKDGKPIGVKVEDAQLGPQRWPYEQIVGEALDEGKADCRESYRISSMGFCWAIPRRRQGLSAMWRRLRIFWFCKPKAACL